jgi:hypothetical protein
VEDGNPDLDDVLNPHIMTTADVSADYKDGVSVFVEQGDT